MKLTWVVASLWLASQARCRVTGRAGGFRLSSMCWRAVGPEDRCFVALSTFCCSSNKWSAYLGWPFWISTIISSPARPPSSMSPTLWFSLSPSSSTPSHLLLSSLSFCLRPSLFHGPTLMCPSLSSQFYYLKRLRMTTSGGRPWRSQISAWPGSGTKPQRCRLRAPTPGWPPRSSSPLSSPKAVTSGGTTNYTPGDKIRPLTHLTDIITRAFVKYTFLSPFRFLIFLCMRVKHQLWSLAVGAVNGGGAVSWDRRPGCRLWCSSQ